MIESDPDRPTAQLVYAYVATCAFWLLTRLHHKQIAAALEEIPAPAPAAAVPAERSA